MKSARILALLLLLAVTGISFGQQPVLKKTIDSLLRSPAPRKFNGTIAIAQQGKVVYTATHGYANISKKIPLQENSQFILGSISKQITAVLVLRELDKGHLHLQDTIRRYLPDLTATWADSVTIHQLLNHTSGIADTDKPLLYTPGTKFTYSPILGYQLLAEIVEKTSGQSFDKLATALFKQCGMTHTTVGDRYKKGTLATSYSTQPNGTLKKEQDILKAAIYATPAGGIVSTAADLVKWNNALHTGTLLSAAAYTAMTTASATRTHRWGTIGYGYGLQTDNQDNQTAISHSGALVGFIGSNIYFPEKHTSIIILENIAPDFSNQATAFFFHDEIRQIIKRSLRN